VSRSKPLDGRRTNREVHWEDITAAVAEALDRRET
jgi:hypothetical protein